MRIKKIHAALYFYRISKFVEKSRRFFFDGVPRFHRITVKYLSKYVTFILLSEILSS